MSDTKEQKAKSRKISWRAPNEVDERIRRKLAELKALGYNVSVSVLVNTALKIGLDDVDEVITMQPPKPGRYTR